MQTRKGRRRSRTAKRAAKASEPGSDWAAGGLELRPNSTRQFHGANLANATCLTSDSTSQIFYFYYVIEFGVSFLSPSDF